MNQFDGVIKSDQAQIDNAKLQLTYSRITAPITGRIGLRLVDPGNVVRANDPNNGLAVVTQLQPIAVLFNIPEDNLPQVLKKMRTGQPLMVEAYDRNLKQKLATGTLLTIDNQIDPNTGTVKCKAVFPNEDNSLFPNQFVNARALVDTKKDASIVPSAAVQQMATAGHEREREGRKGKKRRRKERKEGRKEREKGRKGRKEGRKERKEGKKERKKERKKKKEKEI